MMLHLKEGEAANMILMGMGQDRGTDVSRLQFLKHRGGIMTNTFGMHPSVENHRSLRKVEAVAVGTDARSPGQISETHKGHSNEANRLPARAISVLSSLVAINSGEPLTEDEGSETLPQRTGKGPAKTIEKAPGMWAAG
jgi:hypothetical protein